MNDKSKSTKSSGNVFEDIGFDKKTAVALKIKASLSIKIRELLEEYGLTQDKAATLLGIKQPEVSNICNPAKFDSYSIEFLAEKLNRLGVTAEIKMKKNRKITAAIWRLVRPGEFIPVQGTRTKGMTRTRKTA